MIIRFVNGFLVQFVEYVKRFSHLKNKTTFDRIDNKKGHSLDNCQLICASCNAVKSNREEKLVKLQINLRKFSLKDN